MCPPGARGLLYGKNENALQAMLRLKGRLNVCCASECAGSGLGEIALVTPVSYFASLRRALQSPSNAAI